MTGASLRVPLGFAERSATLAATGTGAPDDDPVYALVPGPWQPGSIGVPAAERVAVLRFVRAVDDWMADGEKPREMLLNIADIALGGVEGGFELLAKNAEAKIAKILAEADGKITAAVVAKAVAAKDEALQEILKMRLPATFLNPMEIAEDNANTIISRQLRLSDKRASDVAGAVSSRANRKALARVIEVELPKSRLVRWAPLVGKVTLVLAEFGPLLVKFWKAKGEKERADTLKSIHAELLGLAGGAAVSATASAAVGFICVTFALTPVGWIAVAVGISVGAVGVVAGDQARDWYLKTQPIPKFPQNQIGGPRLFPR